MGILQKIFDKNADMIDTIFDVSGDVGDFVKERNLVKERANEYVAVVASFAVSSAALPFIAICETAKAVAKTTRKPLKNTFRY